MSSKTFGAYISYIDDHCDNCGGEIPAGYPLFMDGQHVFCDKRCARIHHNNAKMTIAEGEDKRMGLVSECLHALLAGAIVCAIVMIAIYGKGC
jgi:hypothetical protein